MDQRVSMTAVGQAHDCIMHVGVKCIRAGEMILSIVRSRNHSISSVVVSKGV